MSWPLSAKRRAATVICNCGCKTAIPAYGSDGHLRRFVNGHNVKKYHSQEEVREAKKRSAKNHPETRRRNQRDFYHRTKLRAMALLGNKCEVCGTAYNGKNAAIFEFDHLNPEEKETGITRLFRNVTWSSILVELRKCRLVCANCHNIKHGGEW